jgi:type VI secretion system protein ImpJ
MNALDAPDILPEPVSWSEGMLLSPHHFQQNDIYWNNLLHRRLSTLQPHAWGVLDMALDPTELTKGRVVFQRLRCVMTDGLVIDYPGHFAPAALSLDLSGNDWNQQKQVRVHLRVPVRGKGAASDIGDMQRYTIEPGNLEADENTGKDEIVVDRMRPKLSLAAGDSVAKSYSSVPLLELYGDSRGVHLAPFHPPMLCIGASSFQNETSLQRSLTTLSELLWKKYRELLGVRLDDHGQSRLGSESSAQVQAARYLVMALPAFDVMLQSASTHPADLYLGLSQLVGFVAATPGAPPPPVLGAYDHGDCQPGFIRAITYVRDQLNRLNASYRVLEFQRVGASGFRIQLPHGIDVSKLLIELTPRGGQNAATLAQWLGSARTANEELIYLLVRRRYPGVTVKEAVPAQVAALNLRPGAFVYELDNALIEGEDGSPRPLISEGHTLVILGEPDEYVPAAITLYLPREGASPHP